ncbi:MAG: hypothetical protein EAX91_08840 [Candidatus Lokiarchaeota archaeon]|nr:hypothetical protein [Candidatus Lokiarchaeota archaeon]
MSSSKVKSSSTILNLLVIAIGAIFLFKAVINLLTSFGVAFPELLGEWNDKLQGVAALGSSGLVSLVLAFWFIISGIGMFKEAEWAMGQALVVLSITVVMGIEPVIKLILNPSTFSWTDVSTIIVLISFIVGIVGFIWLIITRRRYD